MKNPMLATAAVLAMLPLGAAYADPQDAASKALPYARAGLDEREAAAVLLDRLTYGPRPDEVERVVALGLDRWLAQQLDAAFPETALNAALAKYEALGMTDAQLVARYPNSSQLSAHVRRFYPDLIPGRDVPILDFSVVTAKLDAFRTEHGILSQDVELREQLVAQKVVRAAAAENQLREVLTDFWENHFFTSPINFNARVWILPFERDAIRPNALGNFRQLLGAAARHPAMLQYYVGTARQANVSLDQSTLGVKLNALAESDAAAAQQLGARVRDEIAAVEHEEDLVLARQFWSATGPNEQYARALVEIQTLGPDGPATREDVAEAARAFTGWSTAPIGPSSEWFVKGFEAAYQAGFVRDGAFLFRADQHDAGAKRVLGEELPAGGGLEEGERLLDVLAKHPSTARHIAHKLAVRFVSDEPPAALVDELAKEFTASDGNVRAVLEALLQSPEFWRAGAERTKVKTPFELTASALRATNATIERAGPLVERIAGMGQPIYAFLEPIGFPDAGAYWLDSGSMLARINFAQDLVANRIDGVTVDAAVTDIKQRGALAAYAAKLIPGRDLGGTVKTLESALAAETSSPPQAAQVAGLLMASPVFQTR